MDSVDGGGHQAVKERSGREVSGGFHLEVVLRFFISCCKRWDGLVICKRRQFWILSFGRRNSLDLHSRAFSGNCWSVGGLRRSRLEWTLAEHGSSSPEDLSLQTDCVV